MAMRLSGLMSGMDTDSVIQDLVKAKRYKVDNAIKAQKKIEWKQEAWKSLNTKIKSFQTKYVSMLRFSSAYSKKTTKVSNSSAVSVITGENAVNGVQSLRVDKLAKTGYLTGAEIGGKNDENLTALSKLSDITDLAGDGTINISTGNTSVDVSVNADTTISDVLTKLKEAGLNANFDEKNQRFFISAKESGLSNDFSITASDANGAAALSAFGLQVNLNSDKATLAEYKEFAAYYDADKNTALANMKDVIDASVAKKADNYLEKYKTAKSSAEAAQKKMDEILDKYKESTLDTVENYAEKMSEAEEQKKTLQEEIENETDETVKAEKQKQIDELNEKQKTWQNEKTDAESLASQQKVYDDAQAEMTAAEEYITVTEETDAEGNVTYTAEATAKLQTQEEDSFYAKASYAAEVMANYDPNDTTATGATKVSGQDAVIYLNDAQFKGSTNSFEINGLTITALNENAPGESVTITTQDDTDGIYDMIKGFIKDYSELINEMDKLYNADKNSLEPLTDEEKESMSESEIEKWETKIKDALLRNDTSLSNISSALKDVMSSAFEVNGEKMYLTSFGINALSWFESADNEKYALHIDGNPYDEKTAGNADKLKGMIASDPETVISFFTQLAKKLQEKMDENSSSVNGYRTYGSYYDDKKMKEEYNDYTSKIKELEDKLADYEDKWYAKFSKMETALAKMQSNTSAVTSLLGGM